MNSLPGRAKGSCRESPGSPYRSKESFPEPGVLRQVTQRRIVVEYEDAAAERAAHQVALAPLNFQITEGNGR